MKCRPKVKNNIEQGKIKCRPKVIILTVTIILFCAFGWFFFASGAFFLPITFFFPSLMPFADQWFGEKVKRFERIAVITVSSGNQHEDAFLYAASGEKLMILGPVSFFSHLSSAYLKLNSDSLYNFVELHSYFSKKYILLTKESDGIVADISNDMDAWNAEYTITDHGSRLEYMIAFSPEKKIQKITFPIPKKYFSPDTIQKEQPPQIHSIPYRLRK